LGQLNARQVDWVAFLLGKDYDLVFVLGHDGAVCAAAITTTKMGHHRIAATMLRTTWTERWLGDGSAGRQI
jgi:hypothetical protein